MNREKLWEWDTLRPADAIEAAPSAPDVLAVGTYELRKEDGVESRHGMIHMLRQDQSARSLEPIGPPIECPGVFDLKWGREGRLVAAGADGALHHFRMRGDHTLEQASRTELPDASAFCLSAGWAADGCAVAAGASSGELALTNAESGEVTQVWQGHDQAMGGQVWVVGYTADGVLLSGADDCRLKAWDVRRDPDLGPVWQRRFDAGATSVCASPDGTILAGAYDERVRMIDPRAPRRDVWCTEQLGGGVWRLKRHERKPEAVLCAAMQGGGYVLRADREGAATDHFTAHDSMVYGCEWLRDDGDGMAAATCSFYDKKLMMWQPTGH
eukprot:TRINITY_DN9470_c0_g1_i1.p1 TRINITY_DN9470_c0_g1~~TRINITY_DN9470_c0_g1_i1.p1  ORF type:complete len:327 (+),score=95.04 TRINITY_DN9470_c0_g1_i1:70-1050(+)